MQYSQCPYVQPLLRLKYGQAALAHGFVVRAALPSCSHLRSRGRTYPGDWPLAREKYIVTYLQRRSYDRGRYLGLQVSGAQILKDFGIPAASYIGLVATDASAMGVSGWVL